MKLLCENFQEKPHKWNHPAVATLTVTDISKKKIIHFVYL